MRAVCRCGGRMAYIPAKEKYGCRVCRLEDVPHHFIVPPTPRYPRELVVRIPKWRLFLAGLLRKFK